MAYPPVDPITISSSLYAALASCFSREPSKKSVSELRESLTACLERKAAWNEPEVWNAVRELLDCARIATPKELVSDYVALFLAGSEQSICPSESSYLDNVVYGPATLRVMEIYAAKGFIKDESFREPDDHVALEFLFRCISGTDLASKMQGSNTTTSAWIDDAAACRDFVADHLLQWIPEMTARVEATSKSAFYRALAAAARALVAADARLLAHLVKEASNRV